MKKGTFIALVIAAILSSAIMILPYFSLFIPGEGGDSTLIAATLLGSSIFFTAVFVLSIIGIYKYLKK
jgi:hypothetical protein